MKNQGTTCHCPYQQKAGAGQSMRESRIKPSQLRFRLQISQRGLKPPKGSPKIPLLSELELDDSAF
jgi:hypothetical protein